MSPTSTYIDTGHFGAAKPRRTFSRWLRVEARALAMALRRRRQQRQALHALSALDDRMLRDLGLDRGQIQAVVETGRG